MPLLWISLSFLAGLVLSEYFPWSAAGWLATAGCVLAAWPVLHRHKRFTRLRWLALREPRLRIPPILLLAALFLGMARMAASAPNPNSGHIVAYNDLGPARILAVVTAPPDRSDKSTMLRVRVEQITPISEDGQAGEPRSAHGLVQVVLPPGMGWRYGDRLSLEGLLQTPPEDEDFSYRAYLLRQNIHTYLPFPRVERLSRAAASPILAKIYDLREWAYAKIYQLFPSPEAPLLAGILLGIESDLPPGVARAFQDTGTAHIIAISGFNIAILAELFMKLFSKALSRWWAVLAAVLAIAGYTILVGGMPSVVRAAVMGSMALVAVQIGRRSTGANSLAFTAALMCLFNPHLPWDVSFQLSFTATMGLMLYGERMQRGFQNLLEKRLPTEQAQRIAAPVGEYVLMTLAAQALTLPVILYHFQRLSLSALLANPLILPVQPLVMTMSGTAVLLGAIFDPLAQVVGWLAWPLSAYTIRVVELLAKLPGGAFSIGEPGLGGLLLMYAAVVLPLFKDRMPNLWKTSLRPNAVLAAAALLTFVTMRAALSAPDGRLHMIVFDVQGSQVVFVRAPHGETLLIDGGPSPRQLPDLLGRWLSPFDRRIDALIINDPKASSITGLTGLLERYSVGGGFWGCGQPKTRAARDVIYALEDNAVETHAFATGQSLLVGSDLRLTALAAGKAGSALLLEYGSFRALIPAGTTPDALAPEKITDLGLLILAQRDLDTSDPVQWQGYAPQAVIITAESPVVLIPQNWLRTRPGGWFAVHTDGVE